MDVKEAALNRATSMLKALGAKFAIVMPDGTKHGELEVATEPAKTRVNYRKTGYLDVITAMQIGDVREWDLTEMPLQQRNGFRSSVCAAANTRWGKQSYISNSNGEKFELFRTA